MLTFEANHGARLCNGLTRRRFLEVGSLSVFGLSLADLLRNPVAAADSAGRPARYSSPRSVILIWQHGGPSQLDTFDMKPDAAQIGRAHV